MEFINRQIKYLWGHINTTEFKRFVVVGGGVFVVDALLLAFLTSVLHADFIVLGVASAANIISTSVAMFLVFTFNRKWTFKQTDGTKMNSQLRRYLITAVAVWILNNLAYGALIQLGMWYVMAKVVVVGGQTIINFVLYKYFVFK